MKSFYARTDGEAIATECSFARPEPVRDPRGRAPLICLAILSFFLPLSHPSRLFLRPTRSSASPLSIFLLLAGRKAARVAMQHNALPIGASFSTKLLSAKLEKE